MDLVEQPGFLIVDESFMDMTPAQSLAPLAGRDRLLVLRSFGKFFGLAGLRFGFALGDAALCAWLTQTAAPLAGRWRVTAAAMQDRESIETTRAILVACRQALGTMMPWPVIGATDLFVLFDVGDAAKVQSQLTAQKIWNRHFPWSERLLRVCFPSEPEFDTLNQRLAAT